MLLTELLKPLQVASFAGRSADGIEISDLVCDSRQVTPGAMFVAVRGVAVDAHKFVPQVAQAGAAAVVCEELPDEVSPQVCYIVVANSTIALALLAAEWYGNPSRQLGLVGVTGTNGKTTTATLLYEMAQLMGIKAGLISTVRNIIDKMVVHADQTTPDPLTLNRLLRQMVDAGCQYAFMEVSSHACVQHRIDGLKFRGGIFTNLTRDHLDYHKTVENYINAKKRFFDLLPADAFALVNIDDKVGNVMVQNSRAEKHTYSLRSMADFKGKIIESRLNGTLLSINGREIEVLFTGRFNAYNLTAVYGASLLLGFPEEEVAVKMSMLVPVAGRFQTLLSPRGYTAIVDYAHTPDALVNVLNAIREVTGTAGHINPALAIAQTVLEKGFDVVYISAQSLFGQLERDRFADGCPLMEAVLEADLLVLDDLGTEYVSPYVLSCFYNLLNTRLLEKRPTVYTTNIVDGKAFEARYTEKIASRLGGSCEPVLFLGQDIRKLKSME